MYNKNIFLTGLFREDFMNLKTNRKGQFCLLRVCEDLKINMDLSDLEILVHEKINHGERNIAVAFTEASCLYTRSIALLIRCMQFVRDSGGRFAIVEPNEWMLDTLDLINVDGFIDIFFSEAEIP